MLRTLLIGINIIGIALLGFFQKSDPEILHDMPTSMMPGEEKLVTFDIDKSDITGFAKFQIALGEGLSAEVVKSEGASFTFNNQMVKFIWMALPATKKIQLQMRLIASPSAVGNLEINPRFSYIYANERKNLDVATHMIAVGDAGDLSAQRIQESMAEKVKNLDAEASATRTILPEGVNQWRVEISIQKASLQGFAKVEETVPEGYTVVDLKSSSAVFSIDNQQVKYIWYDIPETDVVTVSYKMLPIVQMDISQPGISGNFSYLKNEETVELPIIDEGVADALLATSAPKDTVEAQVDQIIEEDLSDNEAAIALAEQEAKAAAELAALEKKAQEVKAQELAAAAAATAAAAKAADEAKAAQLAEAAKAKAAEDAKVAELAEASKAAKSEATKPQEAKPKTTQTTPDKTAVASAQKAVNDGNIVNVPEPEEGIFYRVQIAAGKNNLNREVFAKLYNFDEGFKLETASGLLKYTTGYHQVYKAARDDRERITGKYDKFKGPFVAAYNDGERITVQEALMVSSQKWVP
jgi:hypothetical protein